MVQYSVFYPSLVDGMIEEMEKKQKLHVGDCSHPALVSLDRLRLTCPGWQTDKADAERTHTRWPCLFDDSLSVMRKRQKIHIGDRSHPQLVALDATEWTYPGWQADKTEAENSHTRWPALFDDRLHRMMRKQRAHTAGNQRPDCPGLLSVKWAYPGWEQDKAFVEKCSIEYPCLVEGKIEEMRRKQKVHLVDRSHPQLRALDSLRLDYPGWRKDVSQAEQQHIRYPVLFQGTYEATQKKQKIHQGDRSHPQVVALDSARWSYTGWQRDKADAENSHIKWPALFDGKLQFIKRKQRGGEGSVSNPIVLSEEPVRDSFKEGRRAKKRRKGASKFRESRDDTSSKCVVCLVAEKSHSFRPCKHRCVCANCAKWALDQKSCPYCRQSVTAAYDAACEQGQSQSLVDLTE